MYDFPSQRIELSASDLGSPEQFVRDHVLAHRPCVVRGGADDWPAVVRWRDDEYLRRRAGHVIVEYFAAARQGFRFNYTSEKHAVSLESFLSVYRARPDHYLIDFDLPEELVPDAGDNVVLQGFRRLEDYHQRTAFYLGAGGQLTELHYEYEDLVHVVIDGEKEFFVFDTSEFPKLYPGDDLAGPDFSRVDVARPDLCPDARDTVLHHVRLQAGDVLYLPCYWWHGVRSHGRNVALSYKRADRRCQLRAFGKLLEADFLPGYGERWRGMWREREHVGPWLVNELRDGSPGPFHDDDVIARYLTYSIAYEYLCEHEQSTSWLDALFERVKPDIVETLRRGSFSRPRRYLLETLYRVRTGLFEI